MVRRLTRRQFVESAAVAGAALAAPFAGTSRPGRVLAQDTITLNLWKPPGMQPERETAFFAGMIEQYQASHANIKVEHLILPWASALEKYTATFAGDDVPDVTYQILPWLTTFESQGAIAPLDDIGDVTGLFADVYPGVAAGAIPSDGKHYAVPYYGSHFVVAINENIWDQAGQPAIPTTYAEVIPFAQKLTFDTNGKHPGEEGFDKDNITTYGYSESGLWEVAINYVPNYIWAFGGELSSPDGKDIGFNNDQGRAALQWLGELRDSGAMTPLTLYQDGNGWSEALLSGKVGMAWYERLSPEFVTAYPDARIRVIDCPAGPAGQFTVGGAGYLAIPKKSEHPSEAFEFISFLTSPENVQAYLRESLLYPVRPLGEDLYVGIGEPYEAFMNAAAPQAKYVKLTPVLPYDPTEVIVAEINNFLSGQKDIDQTLSDLSRQVQIMAKNAGM